MNSDMLNGFEIIDCCFEVLPSNEKTVLNNFHRFENQFTSCFHDGAPLEAFQDTITFDGISFCSSKCLFAHFEPLRFPAIMAEIPHLVNVDQAPRREDLKRYGGFLSLSKFRSSTLENYTGVGLDDEIEPLCCIHDCGPINDTVVKFEKYFGNVSFCSWSCMLAHVMTIGMAGTKLETAILMKESNQCVPAPPRRMLIQFGGPLTLEKFRTFSARDIFLHQFPLKTRLNDGKISENGEFFLEMSLFAKEINICKPRNSYETVETSVDISQNARLKTTFSRRQSPMKKKKSDFYIYPSDESLDSNQHQPQNGLFPGRNSKKNSTMQSFQQKSSVCLPFFKKK